jgi:hypothetical protein
MSFTEKTDLFSLALEARVQWALAICACRSAEEANTRKRFAEKAAQAAAFDNFAEPVPHLLADVPFLREAFEAVAAVMLSEADEWRRSDAQSGEARRAVEQARVEACVVSGDWSALDLPTPEALTVELLSEKSADVDGRLVSYDAENGVVWITNPYGIDGMVCKVPTVDTMRVFLSNIARGNEYGLCP